MGWVGWKGVCRGGKAAVLSVPWALCALRHIKRYPAVLFGFGLCRVQQVSEFFQFFVIFCALYMIYLFCVSLLLFLLTIVLFIVQLPRL